MADSARWLNHGMRGAQSMRYTHRHSRDERPENKPLGNDCSGFSAIDLHEKKKNASRKSCQCVKNDLIHSGPCRLEIWEGFALNFSCSIVLILKLWSLFWSFEAYFEAFSFQEYAGKRGQLPEVSIASEGILLSCACVFISNRDTKNKNEHCLHYK